MRNQVQKIVAILGVFLGLAAAGVQAQTPSRVEVNIPFGFSAGKTTLRAGVYSIDRMSGNLLRLRTTDGKSAVILNVPVTHSSTDSAAGERLVFNKYGDQYFLSQIWLTVESGRQVWTKTTAAEPERIALSLRMK